jgi:CheY-like chemotaxis protein
MPTAAGPIAVMLVEDDASVREFFTEALGEAGLRVTGIALAERAFAALGAGRPDVMVLDLGMPQGTMQGMELLARLREDPAWRTLPVIILSAVGDVVNRDVTTRLDVAAVLSKPLADVNQLIDVIRSVVR